jgi:1,4-alpha-glucan branching enzyme
MKKTLPDKVNRRRTRPSDIDPTELRALISGEHSHPHDLLGAHPCVVDGTAGILVRTYRPGAVRVECVINGVSSNTRECWSEQLAPTAVAMESLGDTGVFTVFLPRMQLPLPYRIRFHFSNGSTWEREDPYRFLPTLGDTDLHLFNEGTHRRLWKHLGAHPRRIDGVNGTSFAVWAPNARRVSVVGDFCEWDGRLFPMRQMGSSGVFELFIPGVGPGVLYKYEILTQEGNLRLKADPFAFAAECPPGTASRVVASTYEWGDATWMTAQPVFDPTRAPVAIYEVHLGSWKRVPEEGNRPLVYREIAPKLVDHVKRFGFTHIELLPVAEHPYGRSWGYQITGYYAPTARYGTPDDFRYLVDVCHRNGIGVILDWVPAHFPKDDHALRLFDGSACFEHDDPRRGEHPDWGTLIFNYGRKEVRNFLIANALYWLDEFHIDGLRVDAVASMLYRDYSRKEGEWTPNREGGREDLDAVDFLRAMNEAVRTEYPGRFTIAEESTAWSGVTRSAHDGGLGFTFKWNMGWMHDTLGYFAKDPVHRRHHHNELTFAMLYEHTERFIMPLSHDEVVHGKGSLIGKMPGDEWQKFANLRLLLSYQFTRPGKKLLFMGTELAPWGEWNHEVSLDWHLADEPFRAGFGRYLEALGRLYRENRCLWQCDPDPGGFSWIDCNDRDNSVVSYLRRFEDEFIIVVLNLTPVPRYDYRIGAPKEGSYRELLSSDQVIYGGSGFEISLATRTERISCHGYECSLSLRLPPLAALILTTVS